MARRETQIIKPIEDRSLFGIGLLLGAVVLFAGIDTSAKWLVTSGMPSQQVVFSRYAVHLILVLAIFWPMERSALFVTKNLKLEIIRSLFLLCSTVFNFFALLYLPLTVTGSVLFAMPLILTALSGPLLGEQVGWRRWIAILIGFAGVLIIIRPGGEAFQWASILSVVTAVFYALYNIASRKLAGVDSPYTQQYFSALIATICIAPFAFSDWMWPADAVGWIAFLALGTLGGIGHLMLTVAHRYAPASTLAPFIYTQIIYLTASSWLIFGDAPDIGFYIGVPIIIGSGLYIWLRERQLAIKRKSAPSP